MKKIRDIYAYEILDSRGNPTVNVEVTLECGIKSSASVPSGASKGENEALELKDEDYSRYLGKGVLKAINNINTIIKNKLVGMNVDEQELIDTTLINLDGTPNKSNLGANATLGVSLAVSKAAALYHNLPLYKYLSIEDSYILPTPMMNVINGGTHADSQVDFQEYFIIPAGFSSFKEALRAGVETFHMLKSILKENGYTTNVGDEGGFAPSCKYGNTEPLDLIISAIKKAGYIPGKDIFLGLDVASSEFYSLDDKKYHLLKSNEGIKSSKEMISWYKKMIEKYPIITIEDALAESDWDNWKLLTKELGDKIQLVGDDLFVTNINFLKKGIKLNAANAILIKPNQIGTLTETINAIKLAKDNGYSYIISHRSGETEDTFISDLAVATNSGQIKTGSASRTDRVCKYNRLLKIEDELGSNAKYNGLNSLKKS